jgi:hypothetical protein
MGGESGPVASGCREEAKMKEVRADAYWSSPLWALGASAWKGEVVRRRRMQRRGGACGLPKGP